MKAALLTLLVLASTATSAGGERPFAPGTDAPYWGYLRAGGHFGVHIGDDRRTVTETMLREHVQLYGSGVCDNAVRQIAVCRPGTPNLAYDYEKFLRHGTIYVEFDGDRVSGIIWDLSWLPYIDS
jgi:hypothetical protein